MTTKDGVNAVLKVIGATGFAGMVIVAPNALAGLNLLLKKSRTKISNEQRIMKELKRQGLVHVARYGEELRFTITPAGAHRLQQVTIDGLSIPSPNEWDKKWRIVTFDVPVRQSKQRAYFTTQLQNLGFKMLQKSMWAYPFPCFEQVELLASHYNVIRYCTLIEASRLDDLSTHKLLRHFNQLIT